MVDVFFLRSLHHGVIFTNVLRNGAPSLAMHSKVYVPSAMPEVSKTLLSC